jgi:hypothetical protein
MPPNLLSGLYVRIGCHNVPSYASSLLCALLLQLLIEVVAGVRAGHVVAVPARVLENRNPRDNIRAKGIYR